VIVKSARTSLLSGFQSIQTETGRSTNYFIE
jgi:hypothetical protein